MHSVELNAARARSIPGRCSPLTAPNPVPSHTQRPIARCRCLHKIAARLASNMKSDQGGSDTTDMMSPRSIQSHTISTAVPSTADPCDLLQQFASVLNAFVQFSQVLTLCFGLIHTLAVIGLAHDVNTRSLTLIALLKDSL